MFEAKEEVLKYIVHISYDNDSEGSGVIIPIQEQEYSYVLTAKHTFGKDEKEKGDSYNKIKKSNIDPKKITLTTSSEENFDIEEVFILEDEPELDFLIIIIKNNPYLNRLAPLNIYEEDFNYCLSYGYPDLAKEGHTKYESFNCEYKPIISTDKLEIRIIDYMSVKANKGTDSYMSGISGAGVFVENYNKDKIYLAGIVIQGTEIIKQTMVCLDLEKLSKKINNALVDKGWETLKISGAEWKNKFGFDMSDLDFDVEIKEFKEKSKNKFIQDLKDEPLEKFVDKFDNEVKSKLKKEEEKFQKISESYLYIGMNFHQLQLHKRASHYLNKAIEYGGNKNKSYLLDAKSKREEEKTLAQKSEQEKELTLEFINSLYQEIYEYRDLLKKNPTDESLKKRLIELYKNIIEKLQFFEDRNDEVLELHNESLKLYSNFNEYDSIHEQISELKTMIDLGQKFEGMKNQVNDYQKEIERLNKQVKILSTMDKKLDTITFAIKKTNNHKLDKLLESTYRSNQSLVSKIQTMYHQNDRVNKKAKIALDNSIKSMNDKIDELFNRPVCESSNNNQVGIEKIIKDSNWNFYNAIQGLYEKDSDSYNRKLLEMSISFTKREHELHIENLKESHQNELLKVKEEVNSKKIDNMSDAIKNNHEILVQILLNGVIETNKELIGRVQGIYKNSKTNEKLIETLNTTIEGMTQNIDNTLSKDEVEQVIKKCNSTLYKGIKKIYEENNDSTKNNLFREALSLAEKRHQEHLVTLKKAEKDQREEVISFKIRLEKLNEKYASQKVKSKEIEIRFTELKEINKILEQDISIKDSSTQDLINLEKYRLKIKQLEKLVLNLESEKEHIKGLKESIKLSSETAKKLGEINNVITQPVEDIFVKENDNKWILLGIGLLAFGSIGYMSLEKFENKTNINELNNTKMEKQIENLDFKITEIGKESNTSKSLLQTIQKELLTKKNDILVATTQIPIKAKEKKEIYTIKKGDSLSSISKKFYGDSSMFKKIINENEGLDPKKLQIGQKINIPN